MTFGWPHLLWLLFVPLSLLVWELTHRRRVNARTTDKILRAEAGPHSLRLAVASATASTRARVRPWLCLGLACGVVALARPQWGRIEEPVFDQAREILIAIDLSRSMLAPDVKPSRLDRAKLLTQSLLEKLTGERVGLVVFSGTAFLQSPLSSDYEILREFLPALDPGFLPEGGTNYRALIDTSLGAFASSSAADRFLIVLSDGEATEDNWRDRADELRNRGVRVLGLGVGTEAGAMIPDGAGGLVKDERGAVVLSKLESSTLRELATTTNGVYQDASSWIDLAALVSATVDAGQKGEFLEKNTVRLVERFQWPLALALWFLFVSLYYEFPVRPKTREITLRGQPEISGQKSAVSKTSAIAATLLLFLISDVWPLTSARAAEAAAAPEPPLLSRIVSRLSAADQRTARDWAEFGRETVTWGTRLQSSQQPVPEGPVRDALAAVEIGEQLDPKTTDWARLRQELEALLQTPPEQQQKQDQQNQQNQDQQKQDEQQKQDQQKQDQQKQDQQQQQESQQDQSQQQDESQQKDQPPPDQQKQDSAFGDMKEQEPPPPPEESQKVGGVPEKKEGDQKPPGDPALALPLQKLEQLRNQDSPAELFQLMEGEKDATTRKTTKDW